MFKNEKIVFFIDKKMYIKNAKVPCGASFDWHLLPSVQKNIF